MPLDNADVKRLFKQAAQPEAPEQPMSERQTMVQQEQPAPRPRPPAIGYAVDEQQFRERWQQEMDSVKAVDPFDAIDQGHQQNTLVNDFNRNSDIVNAAKHRLLETEEQLATAIDQYLQAYEKGQIISDPLREDIQRLNIETQQAEQQASEHQNNGQSLDRHISLGDAFDRAERKANQRQTSRDQERS